MLMIQTKSILLFLKKSKASNIAIVTLAICAVALLCFIYYAIHDNADSLGPDIFLIIKLLLACLVTFLILAVLVIRKLFKNTIYNNDNEIGARLRNRVIVMFSLVAAIPTIAITIFSAYFFSFGMQSWFNERVSNILRYSVSLSRAYEEDFTSQLRQNVIGMSEELSGMSYDLVHEPHLFNKILNLQAEMRSLNEAMVFQKSVVLAQTSMSFSLAYATIPEHLLKRAESGEIVAITSDPSRVRILTKLKDYNDTYLMVGKLVDPELVDYSRKISDAVADYERLNKHSLSLQMQFSAIFIVAGLFLLVLSIGGGMMFASQIIGPIRKLLIATNQLQHGDLSVRVSEDGPKDDELIVLSKAFNTMVQQLDKQQKELLIAQRALAWSDVARMIAHEIKNPLTPIQLASNMLQKKFEDEVSDKESFKKYIQTILRHTSDIGSLLNEFVNFAKMPSPKFSNIDLVKLLKDFVDSRSLLNDRVVYEFESNLDNLEFSCDQSQMMQVLINLFKNAEDAIEDAKTKGIIKLHLKVDSSKIVVSVLDNGSGFPLDIITKVGEPYFTTRVKGTGLGVAIVQKIITEHGGAIAIGNGSDGGAEIKLIFDRIKLKNILT